MISVVIPTLNEERFLPTLLECLKKQSYQDFEVIVADANSTDKTREIAKAYGAKVVKGGKPAKGRNQGAKYARGDLLLFLDADVWIPVRFLELVVKEMFDRFLDIASCSFTPRSKKKIDLLLHQYVDVLIRTNQFTKRPYAAGFCIICSKRLFERIGGFDEDLELAEDHDFVTRAVKHTRFRILKNPQFKVSVRRLDKEGRFILMLKYLYVESYRTIKGPIKKQILQYEFGNHLSKKNISFAEKKLKDLKKTYDIILSNKTTKTISQQFQKISDDLFSLFYKKKD